MRMLSRRAALGSIGATAVMPAAALADVPHVDPNLVKYWNIRSGILHTLQRPAMGTGNILLLSDSRGESGDWREAAGHKLHNCSMAGSSIPTYLPYIPSMLDNLQPKALIIALIPSYPVAELHRLKIEFEFLISTCRKQTNKLCMIDMPGWEVGFSGPGQTPTESARVQSRHVRKVSLDLLQPQCQALGIPIVDLAARMNLPDATLKPGMTIDSIHFSQAGLEFFTQAINEAAAIAMSR